MMNFLNFFFVTSLVVKLSDGRALNKGSFYGPQETSSSASSSWIPKTSSPSVQGSIDANHPGIFDLQRKWWEWNFCTDAVPSKNFTPPNEFVPENTLFLAGYPTRLSPDGLTCNEITTRVGTITAGLQSILIAVFPRIQYDLTDDCDAKICCNSTEEVEPFRFQSINEDIVYLTNPNTTQYLFLKVDNVDVEPFYIYDNRTYFLQGCSDNRTYEQHFTLLDPDTTGDLCDAEPFQKFNGLDVYPQHGWWGFDVREWEVGEQHTFEFGITGRVCLTTKVILTAVAPQVEKCRDYFGFGFCLFLWFRNLFGFF